jgi:hypothetical protein
MCPQSFKPMRGRGRDRRAYHSMKQSVFKAANKSLDKMAKRRQSRDARRTKQLAGT